MKKFYILLVISVVFALTYSCETIVPEKEIASALITNISNPPEPPLLCDEYTMHPVITVLNDGTDSLKYITINYEIDFYQKGIILPGPDTTWEGLLKPGRRTIIQLPHWEEYADTIPLNAGIHTLRVYITMLDSVDFNYPDYRKATRVFALDTLF